MIIELIGTWIVVGFFSAVGWYGAQKTVLEPYADPYFAKQKVVQTETKPEVKQEEN